MYWVGSSTSLCDNCSLQLYCMLPTDCSRWTNLIKNKKFYVAHYIRSSKKNNMFYIINAYYVVLFGNYIYNIATSLLKRDSC